MQLLITSIWLYTYLIALTVTSILPGEDKNVWAEVDVIINDLISCKLVGLTKDRGKMYLQFQYFQVIIQIYIITKQMTNK